MPAILPVSRGAMSLVTRRHLDAVMKDPPVFPSAGWVTLNGPNPTEVFYNMLAASGAGTLFLACAIRSNSAKALYRSSEFGDSWQGVLLPSQCQDVRNILTSLSGDLYVSGEPNLLFKSGDDGLTWDKLPTPPGFTLHSVTSDSDRTLWGIGPALHANANWGVWFSSDGGYTWSMAIQYRDEPEPIQVYEIRFDYGGGGPEGAFYLHLLTPTGMWRTRVYPRWSNSDYVEPAGASNPAWHKGFDGAPLPSPAFLIGLWYAQSPNRGIYISPAGELFAPGYVTAPPMGLVLRSMNRGFNYSLFGGLPEGEVPGVFAINSQGDLFLLSTGYTLSGAYRLASDSHGKVDRLGAVELLVQLQERFMCITRSDYLFTGSIDHLRRSSLPTVLRRPTLISPEDGAAVAGASAQFSWQAVPHATSYIVWIADNAQFSSPLAFEGSDAVQTIELPKGKAHYWRVRALSGALAISSWTDTRIVTLT